MKLRSAWTNLILIIMMEDLEDLLVLTVQELTTIIPSLQALLETQALLRPRLKPTYQIFQVHLLAESLNLEIRNNHLPIVKRANPLQFPSNMVSMGN